MSTRFLLRLEGALVLLAAVGAYAATGASWGLFAGLLLVPDLFMVGYLSGPRVGAAVYNAGHTYGGPLVLGGVAVGVGGALLGSIALIWTAHIGMDRALGYGLKQPTGFHDTHLSGTASAPRPGMPGGPTPADAEEGMGPPLSERGVSAREAVR